MSKIAKKRNKLLQKEYIFTKKTTNFKASNERLRTYFHVDSTVSSVLQV